MLIQREHADISSLAVFSSDGENTLVHRGGIPPGALRHPGLGMVSADAQSALPTVSVSQPYLQGPTAASTPGCSRCPPRWIIRAWGRPSAAYWRWTSASAPFKNLLGSIQLGASGYVYLLDPDYEVIYHKPAAADSAWAQAREHRSDS